jgi:hypothetical protein
MTRLENRYDQESSSLRYSWLFSGLLRPDTVRLNPSIILEGIGNMHIFQTCRTVCLIVPTVVGTEDNPLSATIPACSIASQKILRAAGAQIAVSKPPFCEFDGLLERLFAFNVVDYAKPHGERKTLGPYLPHCGE